MSKTPSTDRYSGCQNVSVRTFVASRQTCPQRPIRRGRGGSCAAHWRRRDARPQFRAARRMFRSLRKFWRHHDVETWSKWLAPYAGRWPEWPGPTARAQREAVSA